ncbi:uncharacterized protein LOC124483797 isoform X2 [Hypomesus transpacificus]|uniref:uncharacterized protein LOC124483797 isoform X2 n=1 Tax=Hypomesus transpacificus TaxID=137520 RepID=UPI001F077A32|nr:uncharacterized protein LOC124483797 isoform X2 [Hypomesus transpacificus]
MVVIAGSEKKHTEVPNTVDDGQQITRKNLQRSAHWKIKVFEVYLEYCNRKESHITSSAQQEAAQLHILTLLEHIKQQQMQLAAAVNSLAARVGTETPVAEMPDNMNFPLTTVSEVEELEEWLKDSRNSHAKQNMISALGAVGGQNTKRISWNVLSKIFSDTVAKIINWKGVNGKKCFKEMLTRTLLIKAVRKNHQSEIDSCAIRWFNLASDRGGGRKDRAMAKETS